MDKEAFWNEIILCEYYEYVTISFDQFTQVELISGLTVAFIISSFVMFISVTFLFVIWQSPQLSFQFSPCNHFGFPVRFIGATQTDTTMHL